jgi:hypothetical protein
MVPFLFERNFTYFLCTETFMLLQTVLYSFIVQWNVFLNTCHFELQKILNYLRTTSC